VNQVLRSFRPLVTLVVSVGIHINLPRAKWPRRRTHEAPVPPAEPANDRPDVLDLAPIGLEVEEPEFVVARVARDLGFVPLVYDADQVAAITDVLMRHGPPPRGA
jgi:hypothetical protein